MSHNKENRTYPIEFNDASWIGFLFQEKEKLYWGHSATAANANLILHSGNIGEYAFVTRNTLTNANFDEQIANGVHVLSRQSEGINAPFNYGYLVSFAGSNTVGSYNDGFQLAASQDGTLRSRIHWNYKWSDWKTIAFTDSDITGNAATANVLKSTTGIQYTYNFNTDKIFVFGNGVEGYKAYIDGSLIALRYGANNATGLILNSSGNVGIGTTDPLAKFEVNSQDTPLSSDTTKAGFAVGYHNDDAIYMGIDSSTLEKSFGWIQCGYGSQQGPTGSKNLTIQPLGGNVLIGTTENNGAKLQIYSSSSTITPLFTIEKGGAYDARFELNNTVDKFRFIQQSSGNAYISLNGNHSLVFETSNTARMLITGDGNVGIGTSNPQKKLHVVGDLYVDGNIIATKEVSAGGAGQEGESGDGGAEVIDKELAKGQSSYTIPNTIGRSAVAVSLYEWNANNGSWDMCLADISVKDATITVTFGSATSVNHKLVAVG